MFSFIIGNTQIRQRGEGISFHAPVYGLQEVFLSFSTLKVIQQI